MAEREKSFLEKLRDALNKNQGNVKTRNARDWFQRRARALKSELRNKFKGNIQKFLNKNNKFLEEMEINHVQRLIDYLDVVKTPHAGAAEHSKLQKDFKTFYSQYDKRNGKNFEKTFPIIGEWYRGI